MTEGETSRVLEQWADLTAVERTVEEEIGSRPAASSMSNERIGGIGGET